MCEKKIKKLCLRIIRPLDMIRIHHQKLALTILVSLISHQSHEVKILSTKETKSFVQLSLSMRKENHKMTGIILIPYNYKQWIKYQITL